MRLADHGANVYSQFGEDGCIAHIFDMIGEGQRVAVEFGAGDGMECSNTSRLWHDNGWKGFLVEPDPARFEALEGNAGPFDTTCLETFVTADGPSSIAQLLASHGIDGVDLMSIDIDGDDFFVFEHLACRPRVIVVEFNPTVPPHIELRPAEPGSTFGASLLAFIRLGERLGYSFVGATYCNAFFVDEPDAAEFQDYETDPTVLFPPEYYTYAVSDYAGRTALCGQLLPWGTREPYVLPLEASAYVTPVSDSAQFLRRGFEAFWGPARWLSTEGLSAERLADTLASRPRLVCIDLSREAVGKEDWLSEQAAGHGYRPLLAGRMLGLIAKES